MDSQTVHSSTPCQSVDNNEKSTDLHSSPLETIKVRDEPGGVANSKLSCVDRASGETRESAETHVTGETSLTGETRVTAENTRDC